ncbi:MAG: extracellular solute-binding protein, partial [Propionibacteriaceae bacterium]
MTFQPSRRQFLVGSSALLAGTLVGCSTDKGLSSAGSSTSTTAAPSLIAPTGSAGKELEPNLETADLTGGPQWTPPDLSGQTLTLWGLNYAPHVERYKLLIKRFEAATGATVKLQPQDDMVKQSLTSFAGGNPPDVLCIMGKMSDQLVKQGGLLDLTSMYADLKIDMPTWWMPEAIQAYTFGDKLYGVPVEGNAHAGVSARLDLISAAGAKVDGLWPGAEPESAWPTKGVHFDSFDQMFKLATAITQKSGDKVKVWGQNRQGWDSQQLASILYQQDVKWWDEATGQ